MSENDKQDKPTTTTLADLIQAPTVVDPTTPPETKRPPLVRDRNANMFADWYAGATIGELARKYKISPKRVTKIKMNKKWDAAAKRILEKATNTTINHWKKLSVALTDVLMKDITRLQKSLSKNENALLTHEERQHVRALLENINKITRLEDSKPTEITENTGIVEHRVILPPQATRWGVIPPADNVKHVIAEEVKTVESVEDAEIIEEFE